MSAALHASVEPAEEFSLLVETEDRNIEYAEAIEDGCIAILLSSISPILACRFVFTQLQVDPINSSYAAFYHVSREATEQLLGISGGEHNVAW